MHLIGVDSSRKLYVDGLVVCQHVTRQEEDALRILMAHAHTVSKQFILTALHGGRDEPDIKLIDVIVCRLRTKLGVHRDAILTNWGSGYERNPAYGMVEPDQSMVSIRVDADLLNAVSFGAGEKPEALINRLLTAERDRLWSLEMPEVA